ncbi:MAG: hypothetical protein M3314_00895, partial [Actinomycetota bacterium]|nr:hypothetical protein [Actinomycetota bacterium]
MEDRVGGSVPPRRTGVVRRGEDRAARPQNGSGRGPQAILAWAALGAALAFVLLLLDVRASGEGITRLIRPGTEGPAIALVREDFPSVVVPDGVGLDGQQFYAIARNPWHP